jgi:hypothetical protein
MSRPEIFPLVFGELFACKMCCGLDGKRLLVEAFDLVCTDRCRVSYDNYVGIHLGSQIHVFS